MAVSVKRITTFAEGLDHPECVAVHPDGSVWAGGEDGQIYRVAADGSRLDEVARMKGGFILGIAFSPDARWLLACDLRNHCVWRIDTKSGQATTFATGAGKHRFAIPNSAVFTRSGDVFVSESGGFNACIGKILKFDQNGKGIVWHDGPLHFANGLALNADESVLYVAATGLPGVETIGVGPDGSAGRRSILRKMPKTVPDGLAFDAKGNLYVACYAPAAIYRIASNKSMSVVAYDWTAHALSAPTNVAFGGPNFDQLYTANLSRWHITRIDLRIKGMPLACHHPRS
ncbi:MAG: SMP-30/gluconolactonase/LRE family protein [Candidatus Sumerlaeota bacterium]